MGTSPSTHMRCASSRTQSRTLSRWGRSKIGRVQTLLFLMVGGHVTGAYSETCMSSSCVASMRSLWMFMNQTAVLTRQPCIMWELAEETFLRPPEERGCPQMSCDLNFLSSRLVLASDSIVSSTIVGQR